MASKPKPDLLRRRKDFLLIQKTGKRVYPNSWMILNHLKNDVGHFRYGYTIPAYVGGAVIRNRFKRWCREFFRSYEGPLRRRNVDINVVLKRKQKEFYRKLKNAEFKEALQIGVEKLEGRV